MRRFLVLISICALVAGCGVRKPASGTSAPESRIWVSQNFVMGGLTKYSLNIDFGDAWISGIMMIREEEGVVKGTVMNEFGIRAFDFTVSPSEARVENMIGMLDKWYIRKTIAADLQFLFMLDRAGYKPALQAEREIYSYMDIEGGDEIDTSVVYRDKWKAARYGSGKVTLINLKRGITYKLSRI